MLPTDTDKAIDVAELAIYAILTPPALYCLFRHGVQGLLGWLYIIIYCTIRLVAAGLKLKSDRDHTIFSGALIVDNIGLSPLLLSAAGILHEAYVTNPNCPRPLQLCKLTLGTSLPSRHARNAIKNSKLEWAVVLQYHILVSTALALIAASVANLASSDPSSSDMGILKGGFAIIFVAWAVLVLATLFSLLRPASYTSLAGNDDSFRNGTLLLNAVLFSLPMTLLRTIYGAINLFGSGTSMETSSFSTNVAADVCMNLLPPMLATIVFVVVGLLTPPRGK
ncbi:hypothetical protein UA08_09410 [Talaromyces atroroseus]|uniref:DUF7702 domain-containing protein n=1 Tax=Talaromyces atroroseus TaxID=1441469 RepID=A0A1Q5Q614_TALAT|nr:hypothetical protein UA08_09410 [Talaromyces atroroseus]OKL55308.1 hypothetical protein UA08_09410 [Talaromyces atroroseus]